MRTRLHKYLQKSALEDSNPSKDDHDSDGGDSADEGDDQVDYDSYNWTCPGHIGDIENSTSAPGLTKCNKYGGYSGEEAFKDGYELFYEEGDWKEWFEEKIVDKLIPRGCVLPDNASRDPLQELLNMGELADGDVDPQIFIDKNCEWANQIT